MTKITLIFTQNIEDKTNYFYTDYYFQARNTKSTYLDSEFIIKKNIRSWTQDIENWHANLCVDGSQRVKNWWFLAGSRLVTWFPPYPQPLIFALSLIELSRENQVIHISNAPRETINYLKELAPEIELKVTADELKNTYVQQSKSITIKKMVKLALLASKNLFKIKKKLESRYELATYTHIVSPNVLLNSDDHFYGESVDKIKSNLWLIHSHFPSKANKTISTYFKNKNREHIILQEQVSFIDVFKILKINFKLKKELKYLSSKIPTLIIGKYRSEIFSNTYFKDLILNSCSLTEVETYVIINKIFSSTAIDKLLYPYEDKGLERALIKNCQIFNSRSVGYAHAVANEGLLYFKKRENKLSYSPRPDLIACTGLAAISWQKDVANQPGNILISTGTKRYKDPTVNKREFPIKVPRVLVLIGQPHELLKFSSYIEEEPTIFDNVELTIRKYPFAYLQEQKEGILKIKKYCSNVQENKLSLTEQIEQCDIAIFSSTSAGYEAMLSGRIGIYCDLHHIFEINSVEKRGDNKGVFQCHNAVELKEVISKIRDLSHEEYTNLVNRQFSFAKSVYSPPNFDILDTLK